MSPDLPPLPISKARRVWFEAVRTGCSVLAVCLNAAVLILVVTR